MSLTRELCDVAAQILKIANEHNDHRVFCKECANRSKEKYNHLGELKYFCPKVEKYVPDDGFCYMGEGRKTWAK